MKKAKRIIAMMLTAALCSACSGDINFPSPKMGSGSSEEASALESSVDSSSEATTEAAAEASTEVLSEEPSESMVFFRKFLDDELTDQDNYSDYVTNDEVYDYDFYDLNGDGEDELVLYSIYYCPMNIYDVRDGKLHQICGGEGTAGYLTVTHIDGETWICHSDTTHGGRQYYLFDKIDMDGNISDSFELAAYYWDKIDTYDESDEFVYKDQHITMQEFEDYRDQFLYDARIFHGGSYVKRDVLDGDRFKAGDHSYSFEAKSIEDYYIEFTISNEENSSTEKIFADDFKGYVLHSPAKEDFLYICTSNKADGADIYVWNLSNFGDGKPDMYKGIFGLYSGDINDGDSFWLQTLQNFFGSCSVRRLFKISDSGMPEPSTIYAYFDNNCMNRGYKREVGSKIKASKDIECKSSTMEWAADEDYVDDVIPKGTRLIMYRTDLENYVDLKSDDGKFYRLYMSKDAAGRYSIINGKYSTSDFEGIPYYG